MPVSAPRVDTARTVVFAPLDGRGRAELVEQRLANAIVSGILTDGERLPNESELARRLGVALVTAREALEGLRDRGLVHTRRGREGGSFVTFDHRSAEQHLDERLRDTSRTELRDLALHVSAIAGRAAEVAVERASADDIESLIRLDAAADMSSSGGARRAVSRFQLEVAAVSQSPRLVREEIRLQSEASPLLWLCLTEQSYRDDSAQVRGRVIRSMRELQPLTARDATIQHIDRAFEWLLDERSRRDEDLLTTTPSQPRPHEEGTE